MDLIRDIEARVKRAASENEEGVQGASAFGPALASEIASLGIADARALLPSVASALARSSFPAALKLIADVCALRALATADAGIEIAIGGTGRPARWVFRGGRFAQALLFDRGVEISHVEFEAAPPDAEILKPLGSWALLPARVRLVRSFADAELVELRDSGMNGALAGLGLGAVRDLSDYVERRRQGGRAIAQWSAVAAELEALRLEASLCEDLAAAAPVERARKALLLRVPETVSRSLELMGGAGYMRDFPIAERFEQIHLALSVLGPVCGPGARSAT